MSVWCVCVCTTFWCYGSEARLCGRLQAVQEVVDFIPELYQLPAQVLHLTGLQGPRLTVHWRKWETER